MVARSPKEESRRSSKAWDSSRQPSRGILKSSSLNKLTKTTALKQKQIMEKSEPSATSLSEMMDSLTLVAHSKPISTQVNKLYQSYDFEDTYDESTLLTVKYSISKERLQSLEKAKFQPSLGDIYDIEDMIDMVLAKKTDENNIYNTFYCDAYWLIKYIDVIVGLVFAKFQLKEDQLISYDPQRKEFDDTTESRLEQTNIIKDHVSYCDWVATTVGPNYKQRNVPSEIKELFVSMIKKLRTLLVEEHGCVPWIIYACDLF